MEAPPEATRGSMWPPVPLTWGFQLGHSLGAGHGSRVCVAGTCCHTSCHLWPPEQMWPSQHKKSWAAPGGHLLGLSSQGGPGDAEPGRVCCTGRGASTPHLEPTHGFAACHRHGLPSLENVNDTKVHGGRWGACALRPHPWVGCRFFSSILNLLPINVTRVEGTKVGHDTQKVLSFI